jgi:PleD family two-component response regulator
MVRPSASPSFSPATRRRLAPSLLREFNTAVSVLVGFAQLLETHDDDEVRAEARERIAEAVPRVCRVVEKIIALDEAPDRPCVLIIDDDPSELEVLGAAFPSHAFDVVGAREAAEAFDLVESMRPDFVILDWNLSGGGGAEMLVELKLRDPRVSVFVVGERADSRQSRIATLLDAEEYVARPFDAFELVSRIDELALRTRRTAETVSKSADD